MKRIKDFPWPTPSMLERFGAVPCQEDGCSTWVNPNELTRRLCVRHARQQAQRRRRDRGQGREA